MEAKKTAAKRQSCQDSSGVVYNTIKHLIFRKVVKNTQGKNLLHAAISSWVQLADIYPDQPVSKQYKYTLSDCKLLIKPMIARSQWMSEPDHALAVTLSFCGGNEMLKNILMVLKSNAPFKKYDL